MEEGNPMTQAHPCCHMLTFGKGDISYPHSRDCSAHFSVCVWTLKLKQICSWRLKGLQMIKYGFVCCLAVLGSESREECAATGCLQLPPVQHAALPEAGPETPHAQGGDRGNGKGLCRLGSPYIYKRILIQKES